MERTQASVHHDDPELTCGQSVRDAGDTPKLVARSTSELNSIHHKLDQLGNIPNTAWGIEARTNQVSVEIFDGVSAVSRDRIEKVAEAHPGAIRIDEVDNKLKFKATDHRGANGITSSGWLCSAGFNTKNSSGTIYTLTAGHCVPGTGNTWYMDWNGQRIGTQTAYNFGTGTTGYCDGATRGCDWATIKADDPDINPLGTVRYWGGDYHQIDSSRYPAEGEHIDRIGVSSQDLTGNVTKTSVTVNIEGKTLYSMMETNNCALGGDSGGPALNGSTALGLLSGGTDETTCTSSSSGTYRNYFTKVQTVLNERGLHVY
ncbi:S1 family peptidase [Streptomyces sp. 142MFCol3.1]|uniref:S1 family peptidase n=1 Tax=Streptomyces sp. 142MFCol3.1 TaxID=1172179 RepID=UPI00131A2190|nr:S1 family peptidase [Streptomyces sp. 142MFCol3.1]